MYTRLYKGYVNTIERVKSFVFMNQTFRGDVYVSNGGYIVNGKSIMGMFSLNLTLELTIKLDSPFIEDINDIMREYSSFGLTLIEGV